MRKARENAAPDAAKQNGRVVANYGRQVVVGDESGNRIPCRLHGRRLSTVCGDAVRFGYARAGDPTGIVYEILPRACTLERLASNGRTEAVVSNLTQLVAVTACVPSPDWFVVDRYLASAAWCGIRAVIAFNKVELGVETAHRAELDRYAALGYRVVYCSARGEPGIATLAACLRGETSVLVGQSGTGKSSLLNALAPEARAVTQEISVATEEGRHTTTHAVLHVLASGGDLIDSPGVRDYAPPLPAVRDVGSGFVEVAAAAAGCRFQDCLHDHEPGCAVRATIAAGAISQRRFDSYRHLMTVARELAERFPDRRRERPSPRVR